MYVYVHVHVYACEYVKSTLNIQKNRQNIQVLSCEGQFRLNIKTINSAIRRLLKCAFCLSACVKVCVRVLNVCVFFVYLRVCLLYTV